VLLAIYRECAGWMLDTRMVQLAKGGWLLQHPGRGGAIATTFATERRDWIFRLCEARSRSRGAPLAKYIAQIFGNGGDLLRGRQMPSHKRARVNQVSWSSCIGPQIRKR
jgi:pyruvate dehydrogenase E1 component alpha subunit/2-oxoisovalerate dehydrogenase E1 component alpha subunit